VKRLCHDLLIDVIGLSRQAVQSLSLESSICKLRACRRQGVFRRMTFPVAVTS
jgi:hypothetical protein